MINRRLFLKRGLQLGAAGLAGKMLIPLSLPDVGRIFQKEGAMLTQYPEYDVSALTSLKLSFPRERPAVGLLVHTTSGRNSLDYLQGGVLLDGRIAGADVLITRSGARYILTRKDRVAYHAGKSQCVHNNVLYQGDMVSQLFMGAELECLDNERPTLQQVDSLAEYTVNCSIARGWRWPYIVYGHYAVARPLGRRSDPVNFDYGAFAGRLYVYSLAAGIGGLD